MKISHESRLLEWGDLQCFYVIRDISEGMEDYVKGLPANVFWSQGFNCQRGKSHRMCDVHYDFLFQKTVDSYRLLDSLSLDDLLTDRNRVGFFFLFALLLLENIPTNP